MNIAIGIISILLLTAGQTCLKLALNGLGGFRLTFLFLDLFNLLKSPLGMAGFVLYFVSGVLWLNVLSKMEFSVVFPLVGISYVFALIIGYFVFNEVISINKVVGITLILSGIFFLVKSSI